MAVDAPAKIAVVGAGPMGLEAALYARFLGYDVDVFEAGRVADNVRRWGHVRMFTPFGMNRSPLAIASLYAQDEDFQPPADEELLTGDEWLERFLEPLAQTDLLADHIHLYTRVVSISRPELLKSDFPTTDSREEDDFRLLTRNADGEEKIWDADVVIDCSGVFANPNWLGRGGAPALGEIDRRLRIEYGAPDVLGERRTKYAGKRTLVVGNGYTAATTIVALADLAKIEASTSIVWAVRTARKDGGEDFPLRRLSNDRLAERDVLAAKANALAAAGSPIELIEGVVVDSIGDTDDGFVVKLDGEESREINCDQIVGNVGYRSDASISAELQVHQCYATGGPMKLSAALLANDSPDCLEQPACGPQTLLTTEPHFYVLGAKSYGRNPQFLFSNGLEQIRQLFTVIGDREDLDLYAGAERLPT